MAKWWNTWGATVIFVATVIASSVGAFVALDKRLEQVNKEIGERLLRIEIVLGIDPLTKDLPVRTASEVVK